MSNILTSDGLTSTIMYFAQQIYRIPSCFSSVYPIYTYNGSSDRISSAYFTRYAVGKSQAGAVCRIDSVHYSANLTSPILTMIIAQNRRLHYPFHSQNRFSIRWTLICAEWTVYFSLFSFWTETCIENVHRFSNESFHGLNIDVKVCVACPWINARTQKARLKLRMKRKIKRRNSERNSLGISFPNHLIALYSNIPSLEFLWRILGMQSIIIVIVIIAFIPIRDRRTQTLLSFARQKNVFSAGKHQQIFCAVKHQLLKHKLSIWVKKKTKLSLCIE